MDLYSLLGVQSMTDVLRHGRLRWFGHLERRNVDDWVSACRKVAGVRCKGRNRKTWKKFYLLSVWMIIIIIIIIIIVIIGP